MATVTLNRDAVKSYIKTRLLAQLATRVASWTTHDNSDDNYSPAQWWYDTDQTIRCFMTTTMTASMSGDTITIKLTYASSNS